MSSSSANVSRNVKELSEKLLLGWTLLSETCRAPNCNVPLVRDLAGRTFCTNCNAYQDDAAAPARTAAPTGTASAAASSSSRPLTQAAQPMSSTPTGRMQPAAMEARPVSASPDVSRIVQQSPAPRRTGAPAPGVAAATAAAASSAAAAAAADDDDDEAWTPPSPEERKAMEARRAKSDRDAGEIAKYLLAGWTLLNDHCPNPACSVPLVGNKEKQMLCVSCGARVMHEKDADPSLLAQVRAADAATAATAAGTPSRASAARAPAPAPAAAFAAAPPPVASASAPEPVRRAAAPQASAYSPAPAGVAVQQQLSLSSSRTDRAGIVASTCQVLYAKLDQVRTRLVGEEDVEATQRLVALIAELAAAIKAVESL